MLLMYRILLGSVAPLASLWDIRSLILTMTEILFLTILFNVGRWSGPPVIMGCYQVILFDYHGS